MDAPTWQDFWSNVSIFRDAIVTGGLAGLLLGFIGVHVVLRRMVFASSAIAQAAALGVALSFWIGALVDPVRHAAGHTAGANVHLTPFIFDPCCGPSSPRCSRRSCSSPTPCACTSRAVVVQHLDLVLVSIATVVLLSGHLLVWRALVFAGYDPLGARVQGLPPRALDGFLYVSVGLSVALCTRALGALPVFAFSVLPAMAALALTSRIGLVFALAGFFGALAGVGGYAVSFRAELPVGATQTALAALLVGVALASRAVMGRALGQAAGSASARASGRRDAPAQPPPEPPAR
jgi:zinc transport system permease protein